MNKPKVWVVKEQVRSGNAGPRAMDYTPAMQYGELRFITEFDLPLHPQSTVAGEWTKEVKKFEEEYDPKVDYLILTGHTLSIFLIGMLLGKRGISTDLKILVWRREQSRYVTFTAEHVIKALIQ